MPNLPPATKTLTPEEGEYEWVLEERDECQWCRYDALQDIDLPNENED